MAEILPDLPALELRDGKAMQGVGYSIFRRDLAGCVRAQVMNRADVETWLLGGVSQPVRREPICYKI